jgi:hypothetical protein
MNRNTNRTKAGSIIAWIRKIEPNPLKNAHRYDWKAERK